MSIEVLSKEAFDKKAKGLPHLLYPELSAEVICIEEIGAEYFQKVEARQRCIVRRTDGNLFVSFYD